MTGISTLGKALAQISHLRTQKASIDELATQLLTQKKGQDFKALGRDIVLSQRSRANVSELNTYLDNISRGNIRMNLMLSAIGEFEEQSKTLSGSLISLSKETIHQKGEAVRSDPSNPASPQIGTTSAEMDVDFKAMKDLASNLFDFLGNLLNAQDGDRYVLGGSNTSTKPFQDTSLLESAVDGLLQDWKADNPASPTHISTDELISAIKNKDTSVNSRAITDNIAGYSDVLSGGNVSDVSIRADSAADVKYTVLANESPFRDIMTVLAVIKSDEFGPVADVYTPPNEPPAAPDIQGAPGADVDAQKESFFRLFDELGAIVENALDGLESVNIRVQSAQARVEQIKLSHETAVNIFETTVSDIESVDINEVAVKLTVLQTQLQASYTVTASNQQLNLVNFI